MQTLPLRTTIGTYVAILGILCSKSFSEIVDNKQAFLQQYGRDYGYGMPHFEGFVENELGERLQGDAYLDYAASSLYTNTQIEEYAADLKRNMYGNPHSLSSSAQRSTDTVEAARLQVLAFFSASPSEYEVVFTRSCTDSLRLVADTFPWREGSQFKYLLQNHNSVLGIRDVARSRSAVAGPFDFYELENWLDHTASQKSSMQKNTESPEPLSLLAYPPEENFAGQMFPLEWASKVARREGGLKNWRVLLDAAKYSTTHKLNLTEIPADFVTISFYKIFGHPTGVGALLIKKSIGNELKKCYWGGGSISIAGAGRTKMDDFKLFKHRTCERFEDGTVSFLGIAALKHGFVALERVGGIDKIEKHTTALASYLYETMQHLKHRNGHPIVVLYGRQPRLGNKSMQGPIINFNVLREDGSLVSHIDVMQSAASAGIHLRAGAHCNPGAASSVLGLTPEALARVANGNAQGCGIGPAFVTCKSSEVNFGYDTSSHGKWRNENSQVHEQDYAAGDEECVPEFMKYVNKVEDREVNVPLGSVRVSIGYLSTYEDVDKLVKFIDHVYRE